MQIWRAGAATSPLQIIATGPALRTQYLHNVKSRIRARPSSSTSRAPPDFGFAFDIDGVLLRSSRAIPTAPSTLAYLQAHQIPFVLLTNGGGYHESKRIAALSKSLSLSLPLSTLIQSHTPFASYIAPSPEYPAGLRDATILVLGGDADYCRTAAEAYGFTAVITPGDIFAAYPEIWPFSKVFSSYYSSFTKPLPRPINPSSPESSLKIDAVFVFNDPRDWALDIQILLDVLLSREGILGTISPKNGDRSLPNNGYQQDGQPVVHFSNSDLWWPARYHLSRLGQGGFRAAFEGVWEAVTGGPREGVELKKEVSGKPFAKTYAFAEERLLHVREEMTGKAKEKDAVRMPDLKKVYMVGDNPESDIRGANTWNSPLGIEWVSLLTRTGIYRDLEGEKPAWAPRAIVDDVREAVQWGLRDSGWEGSTE